MKLTKNNYHLIATLAASLALPSISHAIPALQLGINGGTYDTTTQTIIATQNAFTVDAYLSTTGTKGDGTGTTTAASLSDYYFLSFALIGPNLPASSAPTLPPLGTISINGLSYNITNDMIFGTPPAETLDPLHSAHDLNTHSIYNTFYGEIQFQFNSSNTVSAYNTADGTSSSGSMYYKNFNIDVSNLQTDYGIHFDLYSTQFACIEKEKKLCTRRDPGNSEVKEFAPFSHDAESLKTGTPSTPRDPRDIPEPTPLALLGISLLAMLFARKRI